MSVRNKKKEKKELPSKNGKKLTKEDKDQLYELFMGKAAPREARFTPMKSTASTKTFTGNSQLSRAKSPGRLEKISDEDK